MAGMIVGFDNDDPSIFEEQFRFIQQARIPISMTGMLNAVPKTPLHERLRAAGRLIAESVGDQFVFTNIVPARHVPPRALRGLPGPAPAACTATAPIGVARWRCILNRGTVLSSRVLARRDDLAVVLRIVWTCILRTSPRRACLTLSMCLETALPAAARDPPRLHPGPHAQALLRVRAGDLEGAGRADPGAAEGGAGGSSTALVNTDGSATDS